MNKADLIAIGNYLYGERWQSPLSRTMPVNSRTIRSWLQGRQSISDSAKKRIIFLAAEKQVSDCMPVIDGIKLQIGELPECIDLYVYSSPNVSSVHRRKWSREADHDIKIAMVKILKQIGINSRVVVL